jgi:hypothetical protein
MPKRPQPVPPIFQPEIPAEAIHLMAHRPRREMWLTWSTWKVMLGQKLVPGYLDHLLAKAAWSGQMTDENALDRPDNLFETVEGDYSAHGRFDDRANSDSSELTVAKHPWVATALVAGAAVLIMSSLRSFSRSS